MIDRKYTAVVITYRKKRLNHRLIFGAPTLEIRRGWHRKLAIFSAGQVFGYERWRADKYGTQRWELFVCAAVNIAPFTQIPGVIPGAKLLLHIRAKTKIKRALECIDCLKKEAEFLDNQPESFWRELHHRLVAGQSESKILAHLKDTSAC